MRFNYLYNLGDRAFCLDLSSGSKIFLEKFSFNNYNILILLYHLIFYIMDRNKVTVCLRMIRQNKMVHPVMILL